MNLPLFLPGMAAVILPLFCVFIGVAVYLLKCKFKNTVLRKCLVIFFLSLAGLVIVQSYWIRNALTVREALFKQQVDNALQIIVQSLQKEETISYVLSANRILKNDSLTRINKHEIASISTKDEVRLPDVDKTHVHSSIAAMPDDTPVNDNVNLSVQDKVEPASFNRDSVRRLYANISHRASLIESILNRMLKQHKPIQDRIDKIRLEKTIRSELALQGIDLSFEYAIKDEPGNIIYSSIDYSDSVNKSKFLVRLYPDDIFEQASFLVVYFPTTHFFFSKHMGIMMISSIFLTLIIVIVVASTLFIIFRQKRLSEIRTDFISNMTHELKTPISTISLASQMLNDNSIPIEAKNYPNLATLILDECKRLSMHVEKVLQMAVFEKGDIRLKIKKLNINDLINNLLNNYSIQIKSRSGNLIREINAEQPVIEADEMHLTNVILNLLDNALKYCNTEPVLKVTTKSNNKGVYIAIKDNGIGIHREHMKKIFDQFYRIPTGNIHTVKGFGLGLSYVRKIVEAHFGTISVESEPGQGSVFNIFWPFEHKQI